MVGYIYRQRVLNISDRVYVYLSLGSIDTVSINTWCQFLNCDSIKINPKKIITSLLTD